MEDQEKIMAMTAEINSLKKERRGTSTPKPMKQKAASNKTQANKKDQSKKTKDQKKKASNKWAWKNNPPRITMEKRTTHSSGLSRARNIIGASIITMGPECGPYTTPTSVRQTKPRRILPPTPTSLLSI